MLINLTIQTTQNNQKGIIENTHIHTTSLLQASFAQNVGELNKMNSSQTK